MWSEEPLTLHTVVMFWVKVAISDDSSLVDVMASLGVALTDF